MESQPAYRGPREVSSPWKSQLAHEPLSWDFAIRVNCDDAREDLEVGAIITHPMTYERILKRAHARTFNLQQKLSEAGPDPRVDLDVEDLIGLDLEAPVLSGNGGAG